MTTLIITLLVAIFKAVPALEGMVSKALTLLAAQRAAAAVERKEGKDAAVDAAIDGTGETVAAAETKTEDASK